jgi:flagellar motor protein MotB
MFADTTADTLAWINALTPLITPVCTLLMAGAAVLWAIAALINRRATVAAVATNTEAVAKAGTETVAAVQESSKAAASRDKVTALEVKDINAALKQATEEHGETLKAMAKSVNGNTAHMLDTMKEQHAEIVELVKTNAGLTADAAAKPVQ